MPSVQTEHEGFIIIDNGLNGRYKKSPTCVEDFMSITPKSLIMVPEARLELARLFSEGF